MKKRGKSFLKLLWKKPPLSVIQDVATVGGYGIARLVGRNKDNGSHHVRIMDACRGLKPSSFVFEEVVAPVGDKAIDAFCRALDSIEAEVARVTECLRDDEGRAKEIKEFSKLKGTISTYLQHAVVPSTLYLDDDFRHPSSIVLLERCALVLLERDRRGHVQ